MLMILIYECDIEIKCAQMAARMVSSFSNLKTARNQVVVPLKDFILKSTYFKLFFKGYIFSVLAF